MASTGNKIGETGATSLSDALKSNTTLTKLELDGEHERNNTNDAHRTISFFFLSYKINREQHWRKRSNIT